MVQLLALHIFHLENQYRPHSVHFYRYFMFQKFLVCFNLWNKFLHCLWCIIILDYQCLSLEKNISSCNLPLDFSFLLLLLSVFLSWKAGWNSRLDSSCNLWIMCSLIGHLQTYFAKSNLRASTFITSDKTGEQRVHFGHFIGRHYDHFSKNR